MRYFYGIIILGIFAGCAQNATVEVGMNDGAILAGTYGDMVIRVTKIEAFHNGQYLTLWESSNIVSVPLNSGDFQSITGSSVSIDPGSYKYFRITIDSLNYKLDNTTGVMLLDSAYEFTATAFTNLVIEENDDYRIVIGINTNGWFDSESLRIKQGNQPFEGATLRIHY